MSTPSNAESILVISSDDALGLTISEIHGLVYGVSSTAGRTSKNKAASSFESALALVKINALELGGNAVVGLRQTAYSASTGGMMGDAVGVVLSGTAVTLD